MLACGRCNGIVLCRAAAFNGSEHRAVYILRTSPPFPPSTRSLAVRTRTTAPMPYPSEQRLQCLALCLPRHMLLLARKRTLLLLLALLALHPQPTLRQEAALSTRVNEVLLLRILRATRRRSLPLRREFELSFTARRGPTKITLEITGAVLRIEYCGVTWTLYELRHPRSELYTLVRRMSLSHWLELMVFGAKVADVGLLEIHRNCWGQVDGVWWQCEQGRERVYFNSDGVGMGVGRKWEFGRKAKFGRKGKKSRKTHEKGHEKGVGVGKTGAVEL